MTVWRSVLVLAVCSKTDRKALVMRGSGIADGGTSVFNNEPHLCLCPATDDRRSGLPEGSECDETYE